MNKARSSFVGSAGAHLILGAYTLLALFPVFLVLLNSFKSRRGIFRDPLAFPTEKTFSLKG